MDTKATAYGTIAMSPLPRNVDPRVWGRLVGRSNAPCFKLMRGQRPTSQVSVMVAILTVLAVLLISLCAYRWKRQYAGLGKGRTTFLVSLAIVIAYNVILVVWLWRDPKSYRSGVILDTALS